MDYIGYFTKTISPQTMKHAIYGNSKIKVIPANNRKKGSAIISLSLESHFNISVHLHPVFSDACILFFA